VASRLTPSTAGGAEEPAKEPGHATRLALRTATRCQGEKPLAGHRPGALGHIPGESPAPVAPQTQSAALFRPASPGMFVSWELVRTETNQMFLMPFGKVCPEKLWLPPPWQGSRPGWTGLGAPWAGGRGPCPGQGRGTG